MVNSRPEAQTSNAGRYIDSPCHDELAAIALVAVVHIVLELTVSETLALWFSGLAVATFLAYLVWRASGGVRVLRAWGMRADNFWLALRAHLVFGVAGGAALLAYAGMQGAIALPGGFWLTLLLYPIWGTTQQFALQNLVAGNLAGFVTSPLAVAGVTALLFAAAHIPRWPLVSATLVSGFFFTLVYRRVPNLWAVGLVHGMLGALAIYLVAGEDPGATIWAAVVGP